MAERWFKGRSPARTCGRRVRPGLVVIPCLLALTAASPGLAWAVRHSFPRVSARYRVHGHAVTVTGSVAGNASASGPGRARWVVVLEQRRAVTHAHGARHTSWVVRVRGRLWRRAGSYRLHWTADGRDLRVMLRVRVVAGGRPIVTDPARDLRLHGASPRRRPTNPSAPTSPTTTPSAPTPSPPAPSSPVPTPSQPNPPAPGTSITVDATHPGAAINPAVFGSDYLAPFGGMGSFDAASGTFWPSFTTQLVSVVGAGSLRFPGGITGQSYQWMRAIGPQAQRGPNPVGPSGRPSPSTVGPDEFGQLLDLTGAEGVMDVDFAGGTAQQAADLVEYMTGTNTANPYVQERVQNGHPGAYDVRYWEVGNEEQAPHFWRAGSVVQVGSVSGRTCPADPTGLYICGGTTHFTQQAVVANGDGDRSPSSAISDGAPDQTFQIAYPPVSGTPTVAVTGVSGTWTEVPSFSGQSAAAQVFELDPSTGVLTFGDGVHGAIPPAGDEVTASYDSGPHDGFAQFYTAMKAANPAIQVCATDTAQSFLDDAGTSQPYDCLQDHPYVGAGDVSSSLPLGQYESQVMTVPDIENAAVQALQAEIDAAAGRPVPLVLTEYGQLLSSTPDPLEAPYFLDSLDEALLNASQLADWIKLGIPVADRQLLDAELPLPGLVSNGLPGAAPFATSAAIVTSGPQTVVQPTGEFLTLMRPLAGGSLLGTTMTADPSLTGSNPPSGVLAVVSAATTAGLQVVVINRSPAVDVASAVQFTG